MKKIVSLVVATIFAVTSGNIATAAPFETLGGPVGGGSNLGSSLGLSLSILGIVNIPIAPAALTGTADASVSLDGSNNGTAVITTSNIVLDDIIGSESTFLGTINYDLQDVTVDISASTNVTGGNFTISSSTPGSLNLNAGTININGNLAIVGAINETVDLSTDPISVSFADLGSSTLTGSADDDLTGNDTTSPGSEINIAWNGAQTSFDLDANGTTITIDITLTGNGLSIGQVVPEPTSGLFLASLAAGACGMVRRRRS